MASSSAKHLLPFLLLTLLSSLHITHARDSQFFNKLPATANNNVFPQEEQPLNNQQQQETNFLPENDNGYGQESSNLPPSSAATTVPDDIQSKQPLNKYRPKNYNPVAYVTEPEDISDSPSMTNNENSNNYPDAQQEEEESEYRSYPATKSNNRKNFDNYHGGGSSFNSDPQGTIDSRLMGVAAASEKYFNNVNGGETNRYQPKGMSDTRSLESGKYFYDVNSEKYSSNHPYTRFGGVRARNEYSDNSENAYEFNGENSIGEYRNQDDFQDEEDNGLP
ncbi:uncharacterized protein LOC142527851 [Primulina tabacum]|uniref:uncharacterized protein LOC142527851 n=1 Tax=Primulina tabacum TaxID=48773 RepID=UPI003F59B4D5